MENSINLSIRAFQYPTIWYVFAAIIIVAVIGESLFLLRILYLVATKARLKKLPDGTWEYTYNSRRDVDDLLEILNRPKKLETEFDKLCHCVEILKDDDSSLRKSDDIYDIKCRVAVLEHRSAVELKSKSGKFFIASMFSDTDGYSDGMIKLYEGDFQNCNLQGKPIRYFNTSDEVKLFIKNV